MVAASQSMGWRPVRPHGQDGRATARETTAILAVPQKGFTQLKRTGLPVFGMCVFVLDKRLLLRYYAVFVGFRYFVQAESAVKMSFESEI